MNVRAARESDLDVILPMVARTCEMHEAMSPMKYPFMPEPAARYRWWLSRCLKDQNSLVFVAESGTEAVGFLVATIEDEIPIYRVKRYGFIHDLWVDEPHRRGGAGRLLVEAAAGRFRELGLAQVRLDVLVDNGPARKLFEACGFKPSVVEMILPLG